MLKLAQMIPQRLAAAANRLRVPALWRLSHFWEDE